ncbi:MAG: nucleoside deaminase [Clostridia bacterium]|nr:nucleoside deaminase [Clostridia bacterium]
MNMKSFMEAALEEAKKAKKKGEVPIGAVIVKDGKMIAKGHNQREKKQNALLHAEIVAINKACKKLHSWRLDDAEIYVTLEPCPMCAGAIANARLSKMIYGAKDKTSQDELCGKILSSIRLNHKCEMVQAEEFENECSQILTDFFKAKRSQN